MELWALLSRVFNPKGKNAYPRGYNSIELGIEIAMWPILAFNDIESTDKERDSCTGWGKFSRDNWLLLHNEGGEEDVWNVEIHNPWLFLFPFNLNAAYSSKNWCLCVCLTFSWLFSNHSWSIHFAEYRIKFIHFTVIEWIMNRKFGVRNYSAQGHESGFVPLKISAPNSPL